MVGGLHISVYDMKRKLALNMTFLTYKSLGEN